MQGFHYLQNSAPLHLSLSLLPSPTQVAPLLHLAEASALTHSEQKAEHSDLSKLTLNENVEVYSSKVSEEPAPFSSATSEITLGERMNSLAPEVLSEIFYWCTPTVDDQESCEPRSTLVLSQVCRHWREITVSSPHLWTYTKVRVFQGVLQPALELMALYLERSKSKQLFIDVDFVDAWSYYRPVLDVFEQIVSKAREYRPAYALADSFLATHLEASSTEDRPTREEWYFWSARPALPSPNLNDNGSSYMHLANTPASPQSTESSVTLRALRVAVGSFILEPYLPWSSSLTFLILKDMHNYTNLTVMEAARILSSFPLLVHCSIHIDFEAAEPQLLEEGSVILTYLQSFSVSWTDWINIGHLLDSLSAPSLRELEFAGRLPDTDTGGEWDHLMLFLRRNNPPLSHLIFDQIDCFHISFLSVLALTPVLEGLWLEDCLLDDTIIRGLDPVLRSKSLKAVVLLECYAFDIGVLAQKLKDTRRSSNDRVKVYVDGCGDMSPAHIDMIREMGLDNLEIGPSSMPIDLNAYDPVESTIEVVEEA